MNSKYAYRERKRSYSGNPIQTSEKNTGFSNYKNIANLTNVLEEATSIFKAHNLAAGWLYDDYRLFAYLNLVILEIVY